MAWWLIWKRSCQLKINAWCFSNVIKEEEVIIVLLDPQDEVREVLTFSFA